MVAQENCIQKASALVSHKPFGSFGIKRCILLSITSKALTFLLAINEPEKLYLTASTLWQGQIKKLNPSFLIKVFNFDFF